MAGAINNESYSEMPANISMFFTRKVGFLFLIRSQLFHRDILGTSTIEV